jgi:hypothetical protein
MDLVAFDRELRGVAGTNAVRPFLCDGSPVGCTVFLVGINPATDIPLWPYWSVGRGCDKQMWLAEYLRQHGRLRPTRARIERLFDAVAPVRALETNIFQQYSPRESDLANEHRTTEVFDFLLERLAPRIVFVHGRSAIAHLVRLTGAQIARGAFTSVWYRGIAFDVYAGHHLAYQWSFAAVDQLGRTLRARCSLLTIRHAQTDSVHVSVSGSSRLS